MKSYDEIAIWSSVGRRKRLWAEKVDFELLVRGNMEGLVCE